MEPTTMLLLAGIGSQLLGSMSQQGQRREDLRLKAMETEMSPWSGLQPMQQVTPAANPIMAMGQGAFGGYQMGSGIEEAQARNKLMAEMTSSWDALRNKSNPPVIPAGMTEEEYRAKQAGMGMV